MTHNLDQKGYIDGEGCVARRSPRMGRVSINCRVSVNRYVAEKYIIVVSQEQAVVCSKIGYVCDFRLHMRGYVIA